ncbi:MAG: glycosyltransferase family 2 protein [Clostridia bacterium]|nr:glycosyltransferase family 2 protein [Clostridia bacterium]
MRKLISFTVPCYNSAEYMHICIDSLLKGGDKVEIIIIDDGSKDRTGEIADEYAAKYPDIIKVVHQENGGHGEGINQGIKHATGVYFKVVDSDDWVGEHALTQLLDYIGGRADEQLPDLMVCNYVYYIKEKGPDRTIKFKNIFPEWKQVSWEQTKPFGISQNLTLHSCMFKTSVMKENGIVLPKHTFYEDNYYVYYSIPFVSRIQYFDLDFYFYLIGRDGQSVAKEALLKRYAQQLKVTKLCFESHRILELKDKRPKLYKVMYHHLRLMFLLSSLFCRLNKTKEHDEDMKKFWEELYNIDTPLADKMKKHSLAAWLNIPGKPGQFVCSFAYELAHRFVKFN